MEETKAWLQAMTSVYREHETDCTFQQVICHVMCERSRPVFFVSVLVSVNESLSVIFCMVVNEVRMSEISLLFFITQTIDVTACFEMKSGME